MNCPQSTVLRATDLSRMRQSGRSVSARSGMASSRRRISCAALFVYALTQCSPALADPTNNPEGIVRDTADKVLEALRQEPDLKNHPKRANEIVDELVVPHFDFRRMSKLVLGEHWEDATPNERTSFTREFQELMVRTYAFALTDYRDQTVRIVSQDSPEERVARVRVEIITTVNEVIPMLYTMYLVDNTWKVVDVSVDNVSVVRNQKASFDKEIKQNGMPGLITFIQAKNWKGEQ